MGKSEKNPKTTKQNKNKTVFYTNAIYIGPGCEKRINK